MAATTLYEPGTDEYRAGTQPRNATAQEHPSVVAAPRTALDVADAVREAAARGLVVRPQATGHGAGGSMGADSMLLDTSRLDALSVDAAARTACAGAGRTWGTIQPEALRHGLLGLAGSSPSVSVSGYTFGGGIGFLSRPHGMASSALRRVDYVDGAGRLRTASDDAPDPLDRDALWAFRGGGGVGVATGLEFDLVPVPDLHAGYLMWPVDHLDDLVAAWAAAMDEVGDDVATSIAVLHLPPQGPFPDAVLGKPVMHLAVAASTGESGALPLLRRMRAVARPVADTWGPADAAKLAGIHLDPPSATPAIGDARWLGAQAPGVVAAALAVVAPEDSPVALLEFRSVGTAAPARAGAETSVPGPYLSHAVAPMPEPELRPGIQQAFDDVRSAVAPADLGRSVGSWMEGATSVPDALPADVRERVRRIADAVDPDGVIGRSRFLT